jgi:hypothetical protein
MNTATSTQTAGEACKAAVEAYSASLLTPTAMCERVLNLRALKSSWRTLSELRTLRKLKYHSLAMALTDDPSLESSQSDELQCEGPGC